MNQVILTVLLLITVILSFLAVDSVLYAGTDGEPLTGISKIAAGRKLAEDKNKWEGELTPERLSDAANSYSELSLQYQGEIPNDEYGKTVQSYWDILYFANKVYTPEAPVLGLGGLEGQDLEHIYETYADNLELVAEGNAETPEQEEYLKEQYKKIRMPVTYEAFDSWDTMETYAEMYVAVLAVIIGFLAAGIFDEEFRNRAELVYFASKYGRTKAVRNKIAAGMITATGVYWAGAGILSLISFGIMGASGFNTPYQLVNPYSMYVMTQGQRYLLVLVSGYIASLLSAVLTMLVTAKMHTAKVAVCIPFFLFYVMLFVGRTLSGVTDIVHFTPDTLVYVVQNVKDVRFFQLGNIVIPQIPFVMLLYFVVAIILLPFIYRSYSRYGFAKKLCKNSPKWIHTRHSRRIKNDSNDTCFSWFNYHASADISDSHEIV